jgi:hypothetical protein
MRAISLKLGVSREELVERRIDFTTSAAQAFEARTNHTLALIFIAGFAKRREGLEKMRPAGRSSRKRT